MAMQHWDLFRVGITRRLCRCDEIECRRCTLPWRPPHQRTRRELIEDVIDAADHAEKLRGDLAQAKRVVAHMAERMALIRDAADPKSQLVICECEEGQGCDDVG